MMSLYLQFFILLPLTAFLISLLLPRKKEFIIAQLVTGTMALHLAAIIVYFITWLMNDHPTLDIKHIVLYKTTGFEIFIDFYFDKVTAVYALVGSLLSFLVTIFSRYYLHREEGFKRYFNTVLLFFTGYNLVIFSGNFETLFIGWEFLGISSFLLIAFYRDRHLPVKNGLKVISIYRFSDICLLLAMWLSHHLWHQNITFAQLNDLSLVTEQLQNHYGLALFISLLLLLAAAVKSALLPFSSWLTRAMEGPTSSSAIFYGSLSVHIGVFLLLRTFPFWENIAVIKYAIIIIGIATSLVTSSIASVQSTVKTQIAYASIVQIGIIFVEVALGFHTLALIHFAGNAFLRTYQLLVSPSVLSYLIHNQFYHFKPGTGVTKESAFRKLKNSLYILSIKEWNLDSFLYRYFWSPFKWIGNKLGFFNGKATVSVLAFLFLGGLMYFLFAGDSSAEMASYLPVLFSFLGLLMVLRSFAGRGDARTSWVLVFVSQLFILLAISLNDDFLVKELVIYLSGTIISAVAGFICLNKIQKVDDDIELNGYHGYSYEQPGLAFIFLLSCLGLLGFPITPTFIGIDILFTHIGELQLPLIFFTALSFVFIELSVLRIYVRVFLGQHKKAYHPIAFRSS